MPPPNDLSARRREILDAAVTVLAQHGWRGLTHRAIDREAGLPEGSSSAYYRSRQALRAALATHVLSAITADVEKLAAGLADHGEPEPAIAATVDTLQRWLDSPDRLKARLEITLAATRDETLATQVSDLRAGLTDVVAGILARSGQPHAGAVPAIIVAAVDGLLITALLRPGAQRKQFVADGLDLLVRSLTNDADGDPAAPGA
ncbi:TetR/AcrR family transcriptional regulator [Nocardioides piscis]|uniref:TetR family transcriptional regulator n=1 Tax=Nocardioides piscis TaxID=2714938 RepID=A0A6G7YK55_9ACTN|nr:TetR/AcrR family transcriptional regulator [Nocardioides piscis]QIK77124.1 TetR family transcriptional regulator [Nocardioides piscis]